MEDNNKTLNNPESEKIYRIDNFKDLLDLAKQIDIEGEGEYEVDVNWKPLEVILTVITEAPNFLAGASMAGIIFFIIYKLFLK